MNLGAIVAVIVPFVIPAILLGSWLVNHSTNRGKSDGVKPSANEPSVTSSSKKNSQPEGTEERLTNKDMTSP